MKDSILINDVEKEIAEITMKQKFLAVLHNKWLTLICRLLLGALFLLGAVAKLPDIKVNSVNVVYEYALLPIEPIDFPLIFGYILPFAELGVGLLLVFGVLTKLAALGGGFMGLTFTLAEGIVLLQGRDIDCGCFGGLMGTMMSVTVYLSFAMIFLGLLVFTSPNRNFCSLTNMIFEKLGTVPPLLKKWS